MSVYGLSGDSVSAVYGKNGTEQEYAYDVNGNQIFAKQRPGSYDYESFTKATYCTATNFTVYMQAFDIHGNYIFQMLANANQNPDRMGVVDVANNSIINNNVAIKAGHGASASFSNEYYDPQDNFPLLYVSSDASPATVYVNRLTSTTTTELIKTLLFPLDKAGYYAGFMYDTTNQIAYMAGYSENNYLNDNGGANKVIISKWDMTSLTQNQDGTYTPRFISALQRPFIYVMQGKQFHDGMLWIASGGTNVHGYIYAIDPADGTILHTYDTELTTEVEGLAWLSGREMIVAYQRSKYEKVTFAEKDNQLEAS